jgi:hypothetical protein
MKTITLKQVEMTPEIMSFLEQKDLIIRLFPNHHQLCVEVEETKDEAIYKSDIQYGSHMLITVTVNKTSLENFGWHEDNEEFLLIGDPKSSPMYLVIALCDQNALKRKITNQTLSADDFVALRVKFNDPNVSFFTMKKQIPHGELVKESTNNPPSFYVTEPTDMGMKRLDLDPYELSIEYEG